MDSAIGGVLFIDEAYELAGEQNSGNKDTGEVMTVLLKFLVDHKYPERDGYSTVVILGGYEDKMEELKNTNQGFSSRFGATINFPDFDDFTCRDILVKMLASKNVYVPDSIFKMLPEKLESYKGKEGKEWANARSLNNFVGNVILQREARNTFIREHFLTQNSIDMDRYPQFKNIKFLAPDLRAQLADDVAYGPEDNHDLCEIRMNGVVKEDFVFGREAPKSSNKPDWYTGEEGITLMKKYIDEGQWPLNLPHHNRQLNLHAAEIEVRKVWRLVTSFNDIVVEPQRFYWTAQAAAKYIQSAHGLGTSDLSTTDLSDIETEMSQRVGNPIKMDEYRRKMLRSIHSDDSDTTNLLKAYQKALTAEHNCNWHSICVVARWDYSGGTFAFQFSSEMRQPSSRQPSIQQGGRQAADKDQQVDGLPPVISVTSGTGSEIRNSVVVSSSNERTRERAAAGDHNAERAQKKRLKKVESVKLFKKDFVKADQTKMQEKQKHSKENRRGALKFYCLALLSSLIYMAYFHMALLLSLPFFAPFICIAVLLAIFAYYFPRLFAILWMLLKIFVRVVWAVILWIWKYLPWSIFVVIFVYVLFKMWQRGMLGQEWIWSYYCTQIHIHVREPGQALIDASLCLSSWDSVEHGLSQAFMGHRLLVAELWELDQCRPGAERIVRQGPVMVRTPGADGAISPPGAQDPRLDFQVDFINSNDCFEVVWSTGSKVVPGSTPTVRVLRGVSVH
jgi:hypothetical protein